jgi:hypothetical protein
MTTASSTHSDDALLLHQEEEQENALALATQTNMTSAFASLGGEGNKKKSTLSIQPQYNICEHYLNPITFIKVGDKIIIIICLRVIL